MVFFHKILTFLHISFKRAVYTFPLAIKRRLFPKKVFEIELTHSNPTHQHQMVILEPPSIESEPTCRPQWLLEIEPFLQNQVSPHTRRAYENDLKQFLSYVGSLFGGSIRDLEAFRPKHAIRYRKELLEGRITGQVLEKSTVNRKLAVIKSFFNWLRINEIVHDNPAQLVKGFRQNQESSLLGLSDSEALLLIQQPNPRTESGSLHRAILTTLFYTGLRKGELISLKVGDLTYERGILVLKITGKGSKIRILPVVETVKNALDDYFYICRRLWDDKDLPLFMPTKNPRQNGHIHKHMNPNAITYIVIKYAKLAGITKKISPHSLRATCISNALDKKASHRSVQYLAGWSSPLMIQRYDKRREDLKNSAAFLINYDEKDDTEK